MLALAQPAPLPPTLSIQHVTVLPMTPDGMVLRDQTVSLRDRRIVGIESSAKANVDKGIRRIDGHGKYLMPALTDSHVHLENDRFLRLFLDDPNTPAGTVRTEDVLLPYVGNGVLQVIDHRQRLRQPVNGTKSIAGVLWGHISQWPQ
jgi:cytosine/adenosine deaminase-related metal-dependent hydrolase